MPPLQQQPARNAKTKILVVDDHAIVRQGLTQVINREPDLTICGEAEDAQQAVDVLEATRPDLAIVDISLKGRNGIEVVKDFKSRRPHMPVLILSMYDDALYAERALRAGARGYIRKQEVIGKLLEAVRRVLAGHIYLSEAFSSSLVQRALDPKAGAGQAPRLQHLTDREVEVLQLVGEGLATGQIAERLSLSVKTIESHREHIKAKLGLKTGGELVRYAVEHAVQTDRQSAEAGPAAPPQQGS